jgi:hypothetical protein
VRVFQYMRDIDAKEGGHNTSFLTRIADNTLAVLSPAQKTQLLALAKAQENDIRRFAEMRLPLIMDRLLVWGRCSEASTPVTCQTWATSVCTASATRRNRSVCRVKNGRVARPSRPAWPI